MKPGTIFISHRAEYAQLVRQLKKVIQKTSRGMISVFISEDISRGIEWRAAIEHQLDESESLFLLYGAPYEDWSWCFYEAGYFAALPMERGTERRIYCLARPDVPPPGPLSHLQIVTDKEALIEELLSLYARNNVDYDAAEVRAGVDEMAKSLFGKLADFIGYPHVNLIVNDPNFSVKKQIPPDALLTADEWVMNLLFGIGKPSILWGDIASIVARSVPEQQQFFITKWIEETSDIVLAAHDSTFKAPQTVLIGPAGRRFRFLLYRARSEGHGSYCYKFLAIDEVGGPALGLPNQLLSLLTGIRMGFRFRYEFIRRFPNDFVELSENDRRIRIKEIPQIIENLSIESAARGNFDLEELLTAFDESESERIRKLTNCWPIVKGELYASLGVSNDGKPINDNGLKGQNLKLFRAAFEAARLLNIEFMSRCCARVSQMMARSEEQLDKNAAELENLVKSLLEAEEMV